MNFDSNLLTCCAVKKHEFDQRRKTTRACCSIRCCSFWVLITSSSLETLRSCSFWGEDAGVICANPRTVPTLRRTVRRRRPALDAENDLLGAPRIAFKIRPQNIYIYLCFRSILPYVHLAPRTGAPSPIASAAPSSVNALAATPQANDFLRSLHRVPPFLPSDPCVDEVPNLACVLIRV